MPADRVGLVAASYDALRLVVADVTEQDGWVATGCRGWSVRDLVLHLHADAARALVAVHTPAERQADCDAIGYWRAWGSDPDADERSRRFTRVEAGLHGWPALRDRYLETSRAAVRALSTTEPGAVVSTQGHAITIADLASTLAVEATLHHLDLVRHLDAPGATDAGLAEVRRVVEALLDRTLPGWSDARVGLVGTGRAEPTEAEATDLAGAPLPVFT